MQCNKALNSTSSKNSVSDTSKYQSFPMSFYNVDNKDKSLPLLLSATSKAFHCKETGVQVSTDNSQNNKSNSCEKKDSVVFTKPSSYMTATGLEPRTTHFLNEHSTIWPNWPHVCLRTFSLNQY